MAHPCPVCGVAVERRDGGGRPREFCSSRCRTRAYRARNAPRPVLPDTPPRVPVAWPDAPPPPPQWPARVVSRPGNATEKLQAGVLAARQAHQAMLEVAPRPPANLAWRAETTEERIGACLRQVWEVG